MSKQVIEQAHARKAWMITNSLQDSIDRLNQDIDTMVACMPVQKSTAVDKFTGLIREKVKTQSMKAVGFQNLDQDLVKIFGAETPLLKARRHSEYLNWEIVPDNNIGLTDHSGQIIDLSFPETEFMVIESLSTQFDGKKLIDPVLHQDEDMMTINFYAAGSGITYMYDTPQGRLSTSFKSPCITVHRGKAHRYGSMGAAWHKGNKNDGTQAANILWDIRSRPAVMLMLMLT